MEKEVVYNRVVDYSATLNGLEVGQYAKIPTSDRDIQNVRTSVSKFQASAAAAGRTFSVHKTINAAKVNEASVRLYALNGTLKNLTFLKFADNLFLLLLKFSLNKSLV